MAETKNAKVLRATKLDYSGRITSVSGPSSSLDTKWAKNRERGKTRNVVAICRTLFWPKRRGVLESVLKSNKEEKYCKKTLGKLGCPIAAWSALSFNKISVSSKARHGTSKKRSAEFSLSSLQERECISKKQVACEKKTRRKSILEEKWKAEIGCWAHLRGECQHGG